MNPTHDIPQFLKDGNLIASRLAIWNRIFTPVHSHIIQGVLQKISATQTGQLLCSFYKPGHTKSWVVFDLNGPRPTVGLTPEKPPPQPKPNTIVQLCRKYLVGRRVLSVSYSYSPLVFIIEFSAPPKPAETKEEKEIEQGPRHILFDLEARPARVCLAKYTPTVPKRYLTEWAQGFTDAGGFFESFCEWSNDWTKTKRRASFPESLWQICILNQNEPKANHAGGEAATEAPDSPGPSPSRTVLTPVLPADADAPPAPLSAPKTYDEFLLPEAFALLPTHIRRAAKTKIQFFERRLARQKQDLPLVQEIEQLKLKAEILRAHLYLWPKDAHTWHVPPELLSHGVLPPLLSLRSGEKPSDILEEAFRDHERLERRRKELVLRIADGERTLDEFLNLVRQSGWLLYQHRHEASTADPDSALAALLLRLDLPWHAQNLKQQNIRNAAERKLPYRSFQATTGEFIRVARSAAEGDAMLRLMPAHHHWLHVLSGEGSHVWLEHPKAKAPSAVAQREAGILALHYSKISKTMAGDVRFSTRSCIEKRKDLPPGKVIIRRAETRHIRFTKEELEGILTTSP